jgi:hypothetical protein
MPPAGFGKTRSRAANASEHVQQFEVRVLTLPALRFDLGLDPATADKQRSSAIFSQSLRHLAVRDADPNMIEARAPWYYPTDYGGIARRQPCGC